MTKENREAKANNRLVWLDSMRGLAAAWVAIFHFNEGHQFPASSYQTFASFGWLGVHVFFIISGLSIGLALQRESKPAIFIWRRFVRLYPAYLASVILVLAVVAGRKLTFGVNDVVTLPTTFAGVVTNLTMTTYAFGQSGINWVYWTLSFELAFYAVVVVALWSRISIDLFAGIITIIAFGAHAANIESVFFLKHWSLFAVGLGLARFHLGSEPKNWLPICLIAALDLLMFESTPVRSMAAITVLSIVMARWMPILPGAPRLQQLGAISYSLYLTHVPFGVYVVLRFLDQFRGDGLLVHIIVDMVTLAACVGLAWIFWACIERPAQKSLRDGIQLRAVGWDWTGRSVR